MGKSLSFVDRCRWRRRHWLDNEGAAVDRTLIVRVALVPMCNLGIHWLICFLYDR